MTVGVRAATVPKKKQRPRWRRHVLVALAVIGGVVLLYHLYIVVQLFSFKSRNPGSTALMDQRASEAKSRGEVPRQLQTWVPFERISPSLARSVLAGEDSRCFDHEGFDWEEIQKAL